MLSGTGIPKPVGPPAGPLLITRPRKLRPQRRQLPGLGEGGHQGCRGRGLGTCPHSCSSASLPPSADIYGISTRCWGLCELQAHGSRRAAHSPVPTAGGQCGLRPHRVVSTKAGGPGDASQRSCSADGRSGWDNDKRWGGTGEACSRQREGTAQTKAWRRGQAEGIVLGSDFSGQKGKGRVDRESGVASQKILEAMQQR